MYTHNGSCRAGGACWNKSSHRIKAWRGTRLLCNRPGPLGLSRSVLDFVSDFLKVKLVYVYKYYRLKSEVDQPFVGNIGKLPALTQTSRVNAGNLKKSIIDISI